MARSREPEASAARRLEEFLRARGLKHKDLAEALGVSQGAVHFWLKQDRLPDWPQRMKIERWTGGGIPAGAWESAEEREQLDAIEPCATPRRSSARIRASRASG